MEDATPAPGHDPFSTSTPKIQTYANRFFSKPAEDVLFDASKVSEECKRITILPPNELTPFKRIVLDDELHSQMENPWRKAIIIKVLGKTWFYPALKNKLDILWKLGSQFDFLDLGNNCYCIKAISDEARENILTNGPWLIAGSFLNIRKWFPNFRADLDKMESAITWVRVLNLPLELFRESVIQMMATCIKDPIKIDGNTFNASRGKFARFCVQVRTDRPLELGLSVNGKIYQVVYENLPLFCHLCGKVGHVKSTCIIVDPIAKERTPREGTSSLASGFQILAGK